MSFAAVLLLLQLRSAKGCRRRRDERRRDAARRVGSTASRKVKGPWSGLAVTADTDADANKK